MRYGHQPFSEISGHKMTTHERHILTHCIAEIIERENTPNAPQD